MLNVIILVIVILPERTSSEGTFLVSCPTANAFFFMKKRLLSPRKRTGHMGLALLGVAL